MTKILGIDLGTSKVAAAVVDLDTRRTVDAVALLHQAHVGSAAGRSEQDVDAVLEAVAQALAALHADYLRQVAAIGLTGQMHGVMLWNPASWARSRLIDWQDRRCLESGFLDRLRQRVGWPALHSGFGWATLAWLQEQDPELLASYECAGTVADYLRARLTGSRESLMDASNAHSWGFFDLAGRNWREAVIAASGVPPRFKPQIRPSAAMAGTLLPEFAARWQLRSGIPVTIPVGDNPASVYATLGAPETDLALTLGTGGQLAAVVRPEALVPEPPAGLEYRPYVDDCVLAVAASSYGGRAFLWLVEGVERWLHELGIPVPERGELFTRLNNLGMAVSDPELTVSTAFAGERHDVQRRGQISGLGERNFSLGQLAAAVCRGVVDGLVSQFPASHLRGRTRVVSSGNAVRRSPLMRQVIEQRLQLPVIMSPILEEAASGVALLAGDRLR